MALLRSLVGALIVGAGYFVLGVALLSRQLGWGLFLWSILVGPVLVPLIVLGGLKLRNKKIKLAHHPFLSVAFFKFQLRFPGAKPRFYVYESRCRAKHTAKHAAKYPVARAEPWLFWWQTGVGKWQHQKVILSAQLWTEMGADKALQEKVLEQVWMEISQMPCAERSLRSLNMKLWMGALLPLQLLMWLHQKLLDLSGKNPLGSISIWLLPLLNEWKAKWFRTDLKRLAVPSLPKNMELLPQPPKVWNSLLWSPWIKLGTVQKHPVWIVLAKPEAFLS